MNRQALYLVVGLSVLGVVGCSGLPEKALEAGDQTGSEVSETESAPETDKKRITVEVTDEAPVSDEADADARYTTALTWTPVTYMKGRSLEAVLVDHGVDAQWVQHFSEAEVVALMERIEGQDFHAITRSDGRLLELYGEGANGHFFRLVDQAGTYQWVAPKGYAAEISIKLEVSDRSNNRKLGRAQQLALKELAREMSHDDPDGVYARFFKQGDLKLSFKALFVDGQVIGPTKIIEAKVRLEGQALTFSPD